MNKIGRQGQGPEEYAVGLLFLLTLITKTVCSGFPGYNLLWLQW